MRGGIFPTPSEVGFGAVPPRFFFNFERFYVRFHRVYAVFMRLDQILVVLVTIFC